MRFCTSKEAFNLQFTDLDILRHRNSHRIHQVHVHHQICTAESPVTPKSEDAGACYDFTHSTNPH